MGVVQRVIAVTWLCLAAALGVGGNAETALPRFLHACNSSNNTTTTTATTTSTDTPTTSTASTIDSGTVLLLYLPAAAVQPSSSGPLPSCTCTLSSPIAPFILSSVGSRGELSFSSPDGDGDGDGDGKGQGKGQCRWDGAGAGWEGCRREVSGGGRNLTVVFRADRGGEGEGSPSSSSFALLAVQALNGSVDVTCGPEMKPPESSTLVSATRDGSITSATDWSKEATTPRSSTTAAPTAAPTDSSATTTTTATATAIATGETSGQPSLQPSITTAKTSSATNVQRRADVIVLATGIGLILLSLIVVIVEVSIITRRKRAKKKAPDAEAPPSPGRLRGKANSHKGGAAPINNSRMSLISDGHNYEDVTDDGLTPLGQQEQQQQPPPPQQQQQTRKVSNHSLSDDYSHIRHSRQRPSNATANKKNDDGDGNGNDNGNAAAAENDYNKLDLRRWPSQSTKKSADGASQPPTRAFYVGDKDGDEEDDDYAEVDDIYEDMEGRDEESTPLCQRRRSGGRSRKEQQMEEGGGGGGGEEGAGYTDCASEVGGRVRVSDGRDNEGFVDAKRRQARTPHRASSGKKRHDGAILSPSLPQQQQQWGSDSRSAEHLAVEMEKKKKAAKASGHRQSKSLDFRHLDRCRQRDVLLARFRSEGDGAEIDPAPSKPEPEVADRGRHCTDTSAPSSCQGVVGAPGCKSTNPEQERGLQNLSPFPSPQARSRAAATPAPGKTADEKESGSERVVLRRKSKRRSKKDVLNPEGRQSKVDQLKLRQLNTELLELETAVRHSMEIHPDELVMIDNVLYGTLPRNRSLPTTEL